jgi:hypothetical protein
MGYTWWMEVEVFTWINRVLVVAMILPSRHKFLYRYLSFSEDLHMPVSIQLGWTTCSSALAAIRWVPCSISLWVTWIDILKRLIIIFRLVWICLLTSVVVLQVCHCHRIEPAICLKLVLFTQLFNNYMHCSWIITIQSLDMLTNLLCLVWFGYILTTPLMHFVALGVPWKF